MVRVLVIGFGNPLRGDDGLGWIAAERLAEANQREDVEIVMRHQLTPELAETASQARLVLFIDACDTGIPGVTNCQEVVPKSGAFSFTHDLDPVALLACARDLYGIYPPALALSIVGESFDYTEGLSPTVQESFPALLEKAQKIIDKITHRWTNKKNQMQEKERKC